MRRYHFLALSTLVLLATLAGLRTVELRQPEIVYADQRRVPSRGGRDPATDLDLALADTGLAGLGQTLYVAEAETGVSAVVLAAICAHESGWGTSRLARERNNLAGLGAYDGQEYSAGIRFDSRAASVMFLAKLLATKYAPGGCYYGGSFDLTGVGVKYASDPGWARKVAGGVKKIAGGI